MAREDSIHEHEPEPVMFLTDDRIRLLEDEIWAELSGDIAYGHKTVEQATDEFLKWRSHYRSFGSVALNGSEIPDA